MGGFSGLGLVLGGDVCWDSPWKRLGPRTVFGRVGNRRLGLLKRLILGLKATATIEPELFFA